MGILILALVVGALNAVWSLLSGASFLATLLSFYAGTGLGVAIAVTLICFVYLIQYLLAVDKPSC